MCRPFCCVCPTDRRGCSGTEHPCAGLSKYCLRRQPMNILLAVTHSSDAGTNGGPSEAEVRGGQPLPPDMRSPRGLRQTYRAWACSCWSRLQRLAPAKPRASPYLPLSASAQAVQRNCTGRDEIQSSAKRNRMLGRPEPSATRRRSVFVPPLANPSCAVLSHMGIPCTLGRPRMPSKRPHDCGSASHVPRSTSW